MGAHRTDQDMTQGVIWKHFVRFSLPMMLGLLFQQMYNTVDTLVVGRLWDPLTVLLTCWWA